MPTASRVFWLPKDPGYAEEYEDACALDEERGRVAIADGVSSAIFSGSGRGISPKPPSPTRPTSPANRSGIGSPTPPRMA